MMKRLYLILALLAYTYIILAENIPHNYTFDYESELHRYQNYHYIGTGHLSFDFSEPEKTFIIITGSLAATAFLFDQNIRDFTQNEVYAGQNVFSDFMYKIGDIDYVFFGALAVYSLNTALQDPYLHDTLILAVQSMAVTEAGTVVAKETFGRARPRQNPDNAFDFWGKGESFFSGHSSGAWSYATVIAGRYPEVRYFAYGLAGCVSVSRIYEDAHWASDVLTGAMVGYAVGRLTLKFTSGYTQYVNILPFVDSEWRGVLVQVRF